MKGLQKQDTGKPDTFSAGSIHTVHTMVVHTVSEDNSQGTQSLTQVAASQPRVPDPNRHRKTAQPFSSSSTHSPYS